MLLVIWIAAHRVRIAGAWLAAGAAAAALIASLAVPGQRGLHARYFATETAAGTHERSIEFRDPDFTRVDARLDFARGTHDFPLAFFNDHTRFNFMRMGEPDRKYLAFAAAWTGWVWTTGGTHEFYLHSPGAAAQLSIDTNPIVTTTAAAADASRAVSVSEGWHRLHVTVSSPYGASREFSAGEMRDGVRRPFDAQSTRTEHIDSRQMIVASALRAIKPLIDLAALAWLATLAGMLLVRHAGILWQRRLAAHQAAVSLFMACAAIEALRFAWPWASRLRIMAAGDDTMVYEGYARDILFHGVLMNGGAPLGQGEPFYYQAFYPYFLAATHAVFGESFFGALFVQRLLVALTAVAIVKIAVAIWNESIWPVALLVATAFVYWKVAPISADMLSESLYVPLLAWSTAVTLPLFNRATTAQAWRAGLANGLTAITRSTALLSWAIVWPLLIYHLRRSRQALRVAGVLAACSLAVFSLIAIRNALVSHRFAPTSTEFGITLRGGNEPPGDLRLDPTARLPIYDRLHIGGYTIEVIEYAIAAPGRFADNMARKAVFALGFYEAYAPGWGYSPVYIANWIAALIGAALLWQRRVARDIAFVPLLIALTQYLAVVIVYPKGERLILPIHVLLAPYAAIAAALALRMIAGWLAPATRRLEHP